jgi:hypothetical protein
MMGMFIQTSFDPVTCFGVLSSVAIIFALGFDLMALPATLSIAQRART